MRYLSLADTERLDLRMREVVPAIEEAFRLVAAGRSVVAPRLRLVHPPFAKGSDGLGRPWSRDLRIIPGALEGVGFAVRLGASVRTSEQGHHPARGVLLLLFDWDTMTLKALISDHLVHAVRSTAPNGVLAKYLALEEASTLGVIGSGRLARWAAESICAVRPIREIRVWSPTQEHRAECVRYLRSRADDGVHIRETTSAEESVRGAQVVVAATTAANPVLNPDWLAPGCTVITNRPEELDQDTLCLGKIVTTYRDGILGHVPPYHALVELLKAGRLAPDAFDLELSEIVAGRARGRTSQDEIIICLNPAYGVLDVATAAYVYQRAVEAGVGTESEA